MYIDRKDVSKDEFFIFKKIFIFHLAVLVLAGVHGFFSLHCGMSDLFSCGTWTLFP